MSDLAIRVNRAVADAPVVDLHTHLFPPQFGALCLSGPDELLTYHYLLAETLRFTHEPPESFLSRSKADQADLVWKTLFVDRTPISEAASGVAATFMALGLDPTARDLREARAYSLRPIEDRIENSFELAGVETVTMTNDPLNDHERPVYEAGYRGDFRFRTVLRIEPILFQDRGDLEWIRSYVKEWAERLNAAYVAVSLAPDFDFLGESCPAIRLREAVLPTLESLGLPMALMLGVRRSVNPRLVTAGDGVGITDLSSFSALMRGFKTVPFLVTTLARENTQELCVLARKFANLTPFGCWWFQNTPSLVRETTTLRLELLGTSFIPQHSDARIVEQLIYKWAHARRSVASSLIERYERMAEDGVLVTDAQLRSDVEALMSGNVREAIG